MRSIRSCLALCLALSVAPASAADWALPRPFVVGDERARYDHGSPLVYFDGKRGSVSIRASTIDHGNLVFEVVAYNDGDAPADFDVTNISATAGTETVGPLTLDELVKASKERALWSQVGTALLAGATAAALSQAHTTETSHGHLYTPHGAYRWRTTYRDNTIGTVAAGAAVGLGVASIRKQGERLNDAIDDLHDGIIQRTTIDPGEAYGGQAVLRKFKSANKERNIYFLIRWNGEEYRFGFRRMKPGEPDPTPPQSVLQANAVPMIVHAQPAAAAAHQ